MASHYAFAGHPNAQSYSYDPHTQSNYHDDYPQRQPTSTFSPQDDDYEDTYERSEMDRVTRGNTNANRRSAAADTFDEKSEVNHGLGMRDAATRDGGHAPPLASNNLYGSTSNRNSIWTADDRHVFFKRSVPARIFRSIFCIVIWAIIIIISVILLVVTFAKPPNVAVVSIAVPDGNDFSVSGTSFKANGSVNFAISNPNSFSATIEHLQAHLYDANLGKSVSVGNGTLQSQKIKANDNTTVVFPFDIGIDLSSDASALISDVATQCGLSDLVSSLTSGSSSRRDNEVDLASRQSSNQLKVLLDIDARISILSVGVSIPVSKNISIDCPTSALKSVLGSLTGNSGSSTSGIAGLLGGRDVERRGAFALETRDVLVRFVEPWLKQARGLVGRGSTAWTSSSQFLNEEL